MAENVQTLMEITGLDLEEAQQILELNDNNIVKAIHYHIEKPPRNADLYDQAGPSNMSGGGGSAASAPPALNERLENLITPPAPIRPASTDNMIDEQVESVRPPIVRKRELLVDESADSLHALRQRYTGIQHVVPLRNFQSEAEFQEDRLNAEQNIDGNQSTTEVHRPKRMRLEDLFRPPIDLIFNGTLQTAREFAKIKNRWLIVNIQDNTVFESQILNRDIWAHTRIRNVLKRIFVFWQVGVDNVEGTRCKFFYKVTNLPHVAIIDPRTGENIYTFDDDAKRNVGKFKHDLRNFIHTNQPFPVLSSPQITMNEVESLFGLDVSPSSSQSAAHEQLSTIDASEEEQMRIAIQNSLSDTEIVANDMLNGSDELTDSASEGISSREHTSPSIKCQKRPCTNDAGAGPSTNMSDIIEIEDDSSADCVELDSYEKYMGSKDDELTIIKLNFPDGAKDILEWPSSTKLRALKIYLFNKYPAFTRDKSYKLICVHPWQDIQQMNDGLTLRLANLHPSATIHLHLI